MTGGVIVPIPKSSISQKPFNVRSRSQQLCSPASSTVLLLNSDRTECDLGTDPAVFFAGPIQVHPRGPERATGLPSSPWKSTTKKAFLAGLHLSGRPPIHLLPELGNYIDLGEANHSGIWTNLLRDNYP